MRKKSKNKNSNINMETLKNISYQQLNIINFNHENNNSSYHVDLNGIVDVSLNNNLNSMYTDEQFSEIFGNSYNNFRYNSSNIIFLNGFVDQSMELSFARQFRKLQDKDLHIVLQSRGGNFHSANNIIYQILNHNKKTRCTIINYAYSGGMYIALACDEIYMLNPKGKVSGCDILFLNQCASDYRANLDFDLDNKNDNDSNKVMILHTYNQVSCFCALQNILFDHMCRRSKSILDREKVYARFFTGSYNHSSFIEMDEALNHGLLIKLSYKKDLL
jgi:hypothetical protein